MTRPHSISSARPLMRSGAGLVRRSVSDLLAYALLFGLLAGGVVLPPLLGLLRALGQYDGQAIVGNYSVLPWMLSWRGMAWIFLLLASSIFLLVLFFAGLFLRFARRDGQRMSRREFLRELWIRLPDILSIGARGSLVALAAILLLGVVPGIGFLVFLREHDINYYLKSHPPEWWGVIGVSALWVCGVGFALLRGLLRISLSFPLWVRGHGGLRPCVKESWGLTRGEERRLAVLIAAPIGLALAAHLLLQLAIFQGINVLLRLAARSVGSALAVIAGGLIVFVLENFAVLCVGVAWLCAIWSLLCDEYVPSRGEEAPPTLPPGQAGARSLGVLFLSAGGALLVAAVFSWVLRPPAPPSAVRTLVIAHRGGAAEAPENSLEALQQMLSKGRAQMAEIDAAMTADGVIVLAHDSDLMRQADDPRKLADIPWAEMSQMTLRTPQSRGNQLAPVARIEDALDVLGTNNPVIIEFKHSQRTPELVARTVALVQERGLMQSVIFMSLDLADVRQVQSLDPAARAGYFVSVEMGNFLNLQLDCLAPRHTLVTRKIVLEARDRGMRVFAWTVDDPVRVVELLELGVDGIITNEPTRIRGVVDAYFMIPAELRSLLRFRRMWGILLQKQEFKGLVDSVHEDMQP